MEGTVQEDDYRTEVWFEDKNLLKIKVFASSGSQRTQICKLQIRDSDPDLNPDPGLNRWHQSGGRILGSSLDPARAALPLIGTGTQHTLGPVRISCLAI